MAADFVGYLTNLRFSGPNFVQHANFFRVQKGKFSEQLILFSSENVSKPMRYLALSFRLWRLIWLNDFKIGLNFEGKQILERDPSVLCELKLNTVTMVYHLKQGTWVLKTSVPSRTAGQ